MSLEIKEPFPMFAWPQVWDWMQPYLNRVCDDYGRPQNIDEFVDYWMKKQQESRTFAIYRDGMLGGLVVINATHAPDVVSSHIFFSKKFWGRDTTAAGVGAVYKLLFDEGVRRIEGFVFRDNHAVRSLARALGVHEEGMLREKTVREGKLVDLIVLGLLKKDFEAGPTVDRYKWMKYEGKQKSRKQEKSPEVVKETVEVSA